MSVRSTFFQLSMETVLFVGKLLLNQGTIEKIDCLCQCRVGSSFALARGGALRTAEVIEEFLIGIRARISVARVPAGRPAKVSLTCVT